MAAAVLGLIRDRPARRRSGKKEKKKMNGRVKTAGAVVLIWQVSQPDPI